MAKTSAPAFQPSRRKVFDAPGLPEPSAVTSTPRRRATRVALGKVPSRYATGTRSATSTPVFIARPFNCHGGRAALRRGNERSAVGLAVAKNEC